MRAWARDLFAHMKCGRAMIVVNKRDHREKWRLVFNSLMIKLVNKCNQLNNNTTTRWIYRTQKSLPVSWAFSDESRFICKVSVSFIDAKVNMNCRLYYLLDIRWCCVWKRLHDSFVIHTHTHTDGANQIFHLSTAIGFLPAHTNFLRAPNMCIWFSSHFAQNYIACINLISVHFIWFLHFNFNFLFDIDRSTWIPFIFRQFPIPISFELEHFVSILLQKCNTTFDISQFWQL